MAAYAGLGIDDGETLRFCDSTYRIMESLYRTCYYAPDPIGYGHNVLTAAVCPSVCLVCPMPEPNSRTEGHRKLNIGMKEAHDTNNP